MRAWPTLLLTLAAAASLQAQAPADAEVPAFNLVLAREDGRLRRSRRSPPARTERPLLADRRVANVV